MEHQEMTPQESPHITWRSILGGEVLVHLMRKQANLIILIMILVILYIDNRYSSQQEMIEIDRLKKELIDTKYDALTKVRFFFTATNLLTFSSFKLWDPEMGSSDGKKYPLNKTFSLGVSVNL